MAVPVGALLTADDTSLNQAVYTTASVTPQAARLVLVGLVARRAAGSLGNPTVTRNGHSYTLHTSIDYEPTGGSVLYLFRGVETGTPTAGPFTITFPVAADGCGWLIFQYSNVFATTNNGADTIGTPFTTSSASATSLTVNLPTFVDAANGLAFGLFAVNDQTAITPGAGFTEIGQQTFFTPTCTIQAETRATETQAVSASWTAGRCGAIAVEIRGTPSVAGWSSTPIGAIGAAPALISYQGGPWRLNRDDTTGGLELVRLDTSGRITFGTDIPSSAYDAQFDPQAWSANGKLDVLVPDGDNIRVFTGITGNRVFVPTSIDSTGATDVQAALQTFLQAAAQNGTAANPIEIVFQPNGTYLCWRPITLGGRQYVTYNFNGATIRNPLQDLYYSGNTKRQVAVAANAHIPNLANGTAAPSGLDGYTLSYPGTLILVPNQNNPADNGIYQTATGPNRLVRSTIADRAELKQGNSWAINNGSTYANTTWWLASPTPTIVGQDPLTFVWRDNNHPLLKFARSHFIKLVDGTLQGSWQNAPEGAGGIAPEQQACVNVNLEGCTNVEFDRMTFTHAASDFIQMLRDFNQTAIVNCKKIWIHDCIFTHAGRQGIAPVNADEVIIERNTFNGRIRHSVIDIEPETGSGGLTWDAENHHILNNTINTTNIGNSFLACAGGGRVRRVRIAGNTWTVTSNTHLTATVNSPTKGRHREFLFEDNRTLHTSRANATRIFFRSVDDVTVRRCDLRTDSTHWSIENLVRNIPDLSTPEDPDDTIPDPGCRFYAPATGPDANTYGHADTQVKNDSTCTDPWVDFTITEPVIVGRSSTTPPPTTVQLDLAQLTLTARETTISEAKTVTLDAAELALTAFDTIRPGLPKQYGRAKYGTFVYGQLALYGHTTYGEPTLYGVDSTLQEFDAAAVTLAGLELTVDAAPTSVTLDAAALILTAQSLSDRYVLDAAALTLTAQDADVQLDRIEVGFEAAELTFTARDVQLTTEASPTFGPLAAAGLTLTALEITVVTRGRFFRPAVGAVPPRVPVGVHGPKRRLFRHFVAGFTQEVNVFKLTDGTYTTVQPASWADVARVFLGGHVNPVTDEEAAELEAAGFPVD